MPQLEATLELDFQSDIYKDAYSRINAIVIEGEEEAYANYNQLSTCGKNLNVSPDMGFARDFFAALHGNFQSAAAEGKIVTCLLIQSLIIECFAIAAYNIYIPVADAFARKITEGVVKDEYMHLNYGEEWLKANFDTARAELEEANKVNLPLVWSMLNQVAGDAKRLGMEREAMVEDFMIAYGEALANIGFTTRDIMRMSSYGLAAV
jgi:fatty aldehyde decarbonylase